jgi:beta propeller repeat protein
MNSRQHRVGVVDLSRTPRALYPAQAPVRQFVSAPIREHKNQSPKRSASLLARLITLLLIPELLFAPVLRAYADEVAPEPLLETPLSEMVSEAPPSEVVSEVVPVDTPTVDATEGMPENSEPATEEAVVDLPAEESQNTEVLPDVPPETLTLPEETPPPNTEIPAPVEVAPIEPSPVLPEEGDAPLAIIPEDSTSEDVGENSTTTQSDIPGEIPPLEDTPIQSESLLTEDLLSDSATTTEVHESEISEFDQGDSPLVEEAPSEVVIPVEDEAQKIARMREELRREVEAEFMRGCITFEASGYYCLNTQNQVGKDVVVARTIVSVESEAVNGSDKEIVVTRNGERVILTQNDWEDAFPAKDMGGESFVWQGMKSGRWQIFMGSVPAQGAPMVVQVTDSRESNFNPKIDGDHLVWQGWVNGNWEIFLAQSRASSSPFLDEHLPPDNAVVNVGFEWGVTRLTNNQDHDMFPSLHGDIVTWQSREGTAWVVYAHSITSGKTTKLSGGGVKSERPQFSITWEEEDSEGRTRLLGYDLATGETSDLSQMALALPRLPERPTPTPVSESDPVALPAPLSSSSTPKESEDSDNDVLP